MAGWLMLAAVIALAAPGQLADWPRCRVGSEATQFPDDRTGSVESGFCRVSTGSDIVGMAALQGVSEPQAVVDDLLDADRNFSEAGSQLRAIESLTAMFADDVLMPTPTATFARGKREVEAALRANPENETSRVEWAPIRGGVSADGRHGFTFGYMTLVRQDATRVPLKYLAYWIKQAPGWRVVVYKRARAGEGRRARVLMPPALPARMVTPSSDAAELSRFRDSLDRAERAFSDEAQKIGLGPAFAKHGSPDAVNMGPATEPGFVVSAEAIGRTIGVGSPGPVSPVTWSPDAVIVASSGDLGVTFGMIRSNETPPPGRPAAVPFVTVWRRASPSDPWRYVAE